MALSRDSTSVMPRSCRSSPEMAETATGILERPSLRLVAVTITSWVAGLSCADTGAPRQAAAAAATECRVKRGQVVRMRDSRS